VKIPSWRTDKRKTAERGYGGRWQREREVWLMEHPLCVMHAELGHVVAGNVVDHKVPHRGDSELFWDRKNWQTLCKPCHDSHKQRLEKGGVIVGCNLAGIPIDPGHHWNRPRDGAEAGEGGG
jgi:5-methylcytosine-specific restriction endonuclease McrA